MHQLSLDLFQTPPPSLANFVVGANAEAWQAVQDLASGQCPSHCLLLWGPPGSGKSHLISALAETVGTPTQRVQAESDDSFALCAQTPIYLAEDVQDWSDGALHRLFLLMNQLRSSANTTLVVSSTQPPAGLNLRADLSTRLASGLVIGLQLLSDDDKLLALHQHARARGLNPDDSVMRWLLVHQQRDIRHLFAYLDALDRFALDNGRALTLPLLREFERKRQNTGPTDKLSGKS